MSRSAWQQVGFLLRALIRLLRHSLRILLVAFAGAGPPPPPHEIRGRTAAAQHESGSRRK